MLFMILFTGVVIDAGRVHLTAAQLQNAADAAALAGATKVRVDQAFSRQQAQYIGGLNKAMGDDALNNSVYLDKNEENLENGDIVIGRFYPNYMDSGKPAFIPTDDTGNPKPNALKAVARRDVVHENSLP